ncbi:hypothetical protein CO659_12630 [Rhizobium sp. S9]|nr:hypothetical protein CO659_12630 [Rhizobium sp. S9]
MHHQRKVQFTSVGGMRVGRAGACAFDTMGNKAITDRADLWVDELRIDAPTKTTSGASSKRSQGRR